ncbi:MAG: hypothetical protein J0M34_05520 [Alphaproteobacteria bacterium]|nr:hypothetical protein [Alphaproteobacteria bacterium]
MPGSLTIIIDNGGAVGHAYVALTDSNGNTIYRGYHPAADGIINVDRLHGLGAVLDDSGRAINPNLNVTQTYSHTISLSDEQFSNVTAYINSVTANPGVYNLGSNNCANFVQGVYGAAGQSGDIGDLFTPEQLDTIGSIGEYIDNIYNLLNSPYDLLVPFALDGFLDLSNELFGNPLISPLVLDLDGDGIELLSLANSHAFFDLDNNDFMQHTGWVMPDDGLLARDVNGDGVINDISELFGTQTTNGFTALDALDSNNDNLITATDANFVQLRVWQDTNGNGYSEANELHTLSELGITSINLNYTAGGGTNQGHTIDGTSTYTINGNTRSIVDVWFENDPTRSYYDYPNNFVYNEAVFDLPLLHGYGTTPNLWVSMTNDATLLGMVNSLATQNFTTFNYAAFHNAVEAILIRWTGSDDVVAGSRGVNINAQHLEALEELIGSSFYDDVNGTGTPNPNANTGVNLEINWNHLVDAVAARLLVQIADTSSNHPLAWASGINYNYLQDDLVGNLDAMIDALAASQPSTAAALQDYWSQWLPAINVISNALGVTDAQYIAALQGTYLDTINPLSSALYRSESFQLATSGAEQISGLMVYSGGGATAPNLVHANDTIIGGLGNDSISGSNSAGNDTYIHNAGDGADSIGDAGGNDILQFGEGLVYADTTFSLNGSVLDINVDGVSSVRIAGFKPGGNIGNNIEAFAYADGNVLTKYDIDNILTGTTPSGQTLTGNANDNYFFGAMGADTVSGLGGNDYLASGGGNDLVTGGDGNDTLAGGLGNDTLSGGSGDDVVWGGDGNDALFGNQGSDTLMGGKGADAFTIDHSATALTIVDFVHGTDVIIIPQTQRCIVYPLNPKQLNASDIDSFSDLTIAQVGADTTITIPRAGTDLVITLTNFTASTLTASDFLFGGASQASLKSGTAKETLISSYENDTLTFDIDAELDGIGSALSFDIIEGGMLATSEVADLDGSGNLQLVGGTTFQLVGAIAHGGTVYDYFGKTYNDQLFG